MLKGLTIIAIWFFGFLCGTIVHGQEKSIVRILSHGASAVVIASSKGNTWIIGCAHMLKGRGYLRKGIKMDGPRQEMAPLVLAKATLKRYDFASDLCLIHLANGPFHVTPVSKVRSSGQVISLGYDSMKRIMTIRSDVIVAYEGGTTLTRGKPWHGRSGGALVDARTRKLVGIVQGYEGGPRGRGVYIGLSTIRRFLWREQQLVKPFVQPQLFTSPLPINC